jgi:hypothetical protein
VSRVYWTLVSESKNYLERYVAFCVRNGNMRTCSVLFDPNRNVYLSIERFYAERTKDGWEPEGITIQIDGTVDDGSFAALLVPMRRYKKTPFHDLELQAQFLAAGRILGEDGRPVLVCSHGSKRPRRPGSPLISRVGDKIAKVVGARSVYDFKSTFDLETLSACSPKEEPEDSELEIAWKDLKGSLEGRRVVLIGDFFVRYLGESGWKGAVHPFQALGILPSPTAEHRALYEDVLRRSLGILNVAGRFVLPQVRPPKSPPPSDDPQRP